jgi:hypothetical protein
LGSRGSEACYISAKAQQAFLLWVKISFYRRIRKYSMILKILKGDSLMEICYAFIGIVGKLKIFYTFFS